MTLWDLIAGAAADHPDRVVIADDHGRALTAARLRDEAERVAAGLGVRPGQVVSWQLPTTLEAAVLAAALARAGAVQNPIITVLRDREIRLITAQLQTSLLIVPETWRGFSHGDMARRVAAERDMAVIALQTEGDVGPRLRLPTAQPATLPPPPTDANACRWVYFSSGTTAEPKGARHSDASLIAGSLGMTDLLGLGDGDVYPIAWPYPHIGGMIMMAAALRRGGTLVLFDTFDPSGTPGRMATHDPTILGSAAPFFHAYLEAQRRHGAEPLFPSLRVFAAGGAPTPPEMVRELVALFGVSGVLNSWGLTEFPVATCLAPHDPPGKVATAGRPSPGVEVRVVAGELRVRGPQCFLGYVDPALDGAAFDDDGWFRSGDLGEVDDDGFVSVTGRVKDVIIRNAENISAQEVEDVLLRHPHIADAAVVGIPDARTGERVCAVIVPRSGHRVTLESLADHCAVAGLARYKIPEQLEVVDALARNAMGKVVKQELRQQLAPRSGNMQE